MKPNYRPNPNTSLLNVIPAENSARSRSVRNYNGVSQSPLDNPLFDVKLDKVPKAIPIFDHIAEREIKLSEDKRKFFSPKQYQTIISNFDLSNTNANESNGVYVYNACDSKYYGNTFGRAGLEKVFRFDSGCLSMPRTFDFDQTRMYAQLETTCNNMGNFGPDYMFILYPDTALSTPTRVVFKPMESSFQMNGYCSLNDIRLQIRDISSNLVLPHPFMDFTVASTGATTFLTSPNHGLIAGMKVYLNSNSQYKYRLPRVYTIISTTTNDIEISADTSNLPFLVGITLPLVVDDYVFNYNVKIFSIREDENNSMPSVR